MRVSSSDLFKLAYGRYAIGAYNVQNMEQVLGVFRGAQLAQAPVLVAVVPFAREYAGPEMIEGMVRAAEKMYPDVVYGMHLDHGDEPSCLDCIESGCCTSIMIDASHQPFADNVAITRKIVEKAHAHGIAVEAELGVVGGLEGHDDPDDQGDPALTDPDEAAEFVRLTGCDSLAVAIGTSHGAYKFKGDPNLRFDRLAQIQARLPGFPLVLHGASSVPLEEVQRINAAGGRLDASAKGVDDDDFAKAYPLGVTKVNIHTDAHLVWMRVHREHMLQQPQNIDFRHPGGEFMADLAQLVVHKSHKLGSSGRTEEVQAALS
jgi:fructose-bisphosphate aldolase, class II